MGVEGPAAEKGGRVYWLCGAGVCNGAVGAGVCDGAVGVGVCNGTEGAGVCNGTEGVGACTCIINRLMVEYGMFT